MSLSIYLGQIFGLYLFITSLALLINQKFFKKAIEDAVKNAAILMIMGIITLILGLILVISHNVWVRNWRIIITIISWLILIKGILMFIFPNMCANFLKKWQVKYKMHFLDSIKWVYWVCLVVGIYLIYLIYFRLDATPHLAF